jgi:hypothetical protein
MISNKGETIGSMKNKMFHCYNSTQKKHIQELKNSYLEIGKSNGNITFKNKFRRKPRSEDNYR